MRYRIFASIVPSKEKLMPYKALAEALNINFCTDLKIIEANSKNEAIRKFCKKYDESIDQLDSRSAYFYFLDENGNIK